MARYFYYKLSVQLTQFSISLEGKNLTFVTENIVIKMENGNIGQRKDCCGGFHCSFLGTDS